MKHIIFKCLFIFLTTICYIPVVQAQQIDTIYNSDTEVLYDTERQYNSTARWYVDFGSSVFVEIDYLVAGRYDDLFQIYTVDEEWNTVSELAGGYGVSSTRPVSTVVSNIPNGKMLIIYHMYDEEYRPPFEDSYGFYFKVTAKANAGLTYGYDAAGNRTSRTIVMPTSATLRSDVAEAPSVFEETIEYSDGIKTKDAEIKIYPNPTNGVFAIEVLNVTENVRGEIRLYQSDGREIGKKEFDRNNRAEFDISGESQGVYFVNIHIGDKVSSWKIIKQ